FEERNQHVQQSGILCAGRGREHDGGRGRLGAGRRPGQAQNDEGGHETSHARHYAPKNILCSARGSTLCRVRRILHATDFSGASSAALRAAVETARRDRAELVICHVITPPAPLVADAYITPGVWNTLLRSQRASAQRRLDTLVAKARRARIRARGLLAE